MRRLALSIATACGLASCASPQDYMHAAGPAARGLASLGWLTLAAFSAASVVVWVLILWIVMRRRGTLDTHAPIDADGGQRWILIGISRMYLGAHHLSDVVCAAFLGTLCALVVAYFLLFQIGGRQKRIEK